MRDAIPAGEASASERGSGAGADFFKGHGLGNDYLVFAAGTAWPLTASSIARVCDRWRGVGGDGIVLLLPAEGPARQSGRAAGVGAGGPAAGAPPPFRLRMFNPDGSEFERSGNGLRVLASYLASRGEVGADPFDVEVGGSRLRMQVHGRDGSGTWDVSVEMGPAGLEDEDVAVDRPQLEADSTLPLPPNSFRTVSIGNPHCVIFTDDLSEGMLARVGPAVATHPAFRNGTNVQLARPVGERRIRIAIWERGVGPTSASGTSSCAAAVAAVTRGLVPPGEVAVEMAGGELRVTVTAELDVTLRGPVQEVATGTLAPGFAHALGRLES